MSFIQRLPIFRGTNVLICMGQNQVLFIQRCSLLTVLCKGSTAAEIFPLSLSSRAQLEAKSKDSANLAGGKAASKSDDIKQLQKQLEQTWDDLKQTRDDLKQTRDDLKGSQDRCRELERQVKQLKHSLHAQQQSTRNLGEGGGKGREEEEREEEMREKEKEILELREKLLAAQVREQLAVIFSWHLYTFRQLITIVGIIIQHSTLKR